MFYKIYCNLNHALEAVLPRVHLLGRLTRLAVSVHSRYLVVLRYRTVQFGRSFLPACVQYWNSVDEPCLAGYGESDFKFLINRAILFG